MNRRDIELLISAKDTSARTFQQVAASINDLADTIDRQAEAAGRGEIKLRELQATQAKLGEVGDELAALQGLIDAYTRLVATQEKNENELSQLNEQHAALTQTIAQAGTATARQENQLASLEKRIGTLTARVTEGRTAIQSQGEVMERAGIDTRNLAAAQDQIVNSARRTGQALVSAKTAVAEYDGELYKSVQASRAAGEAIDLSFANKGVRFQENTRFINELIADMQRAEAQARESAKALQDFQQIGRDALQAQAAARPAASAAPVVDYNQVAAGLRAIVQPGQEALRTLEGIDNVITQQAAILDGGKKQVQEYSSALSQINEAAAALVRAGSLIDTFKQQDAAVDAAKAKLAEAQAEVTRLGQAISTATTPSKELVTQLRQAEAAAGSAERALHTEQTRLQGLSQSLKQAGIDVHNLAAAEQQLAATAQKTAAAQAGLQAQTKGKGFLGLDAYQLQNLGFQVNDIFTTIASQGLSVGSVLRTLAQQGGQITQIFPGATAAILRFALPLAPLIVVIVALSAVIGGLAARAAELEAFKKALSLNVDGTMYDPKQLQAISTELQNLGVSAEDAQKAIITLVNEGIQPDKIKDFSVAAAEMADVLGKSVPDAAKDLAEGLTGGYDAVVKLDEATNALTAEERAHAKQLFDTGQTAQARQYVFDRVKEKMDDMAEANRTVWQVAAKNFRTAWNNLLDTLGVTKFIQDASDYIEDLGTAVAFLSGLLAGKSIDQAGREAVAGTRAAREASRAQRERQQTQQRQVKIDQDYLADLREQTQATKGITQAEYVRRKGLEALRRAQAAGVSGPAALEAQRIAQDAARRELRDNPDMLQTSASKKAEAAGKRAEAAQRKREREAEAAANRIKAVQSTLTGQLRELDQQVSRGAISSLEDRLHAVDVQYEKIFDTIKKLRALGINQTADGVSLDVVEAQVKASKKRLQTEVTLKYYEDETNNLIKQRKADIEAISEAQKRGSITVAEATAQAAAVDAKYRPQIIASAQKALQIARAVAGTKPNPEMAALISSLERIIAGETTGNVLDTSVAQIGLEGLAKQEKDLNTLIADRNDLVESYNTLVQLGVMTEDEARTKTAAAYAATQEAITKQTAALRQTIELLHQLGIINDTVYNSWIAKIQAVNEQAKYTDARITQINQAAQQAIAQGVTDAFHTAASAIVGLIDGTKSWGDALNDVLTAGLSLVGKFLQSLADVLIQLVALRVAKSIIGSSSGFGGLFFHGGGVVGRGGGRRIGGKAPAAVWAMAPRLHGGGGLGLGPGEYRAVLKRNEEVLTEDDPRNVLNGGGTGQGPSGGQDPSSGLKQVLVFDPNEIPRAMQGKAGQRVILTMIRTNKETIKQALGVK
jgi:chromosome segregation ATPase